MFNNTLRAKAGPNYRIKFDSQTTQPMSILCLIISNSRDENPDDVTTVCLDTIIVVIVDNPSDVKDNSKYR